MAPAVKGIKMSRKGSRSMRHRRLKVMEEITLVLGQLMRSRPESKKRWHRESRAAQGSRRPRRDASTRSRTFR